MFLLKQLIIHTDFIIDELAYVTYWLRVTAFRSLAYLLVESECLVDLSYLLVESDSVFWLTCLTCWLRVTVFFG